MTAPRGYIPDGPSRGRAVPRLLPPEVRQEAFAAVLDGVELGTYDRRIVLADPVG